MSTRIKILCLLVILLVSVGASVFMFFKAFLDAGANDYTTEILAATLGTIMTIIITAILLQAQSAVEEDKDKSLGVCQYKFSSCIPGFSTLSTTISSMSTS